MRWHASFAAAHWEHKRIGLVEVSAMLCTFALAVNLIEREMLSSRSFMSTKDAAGPIILTSLPSEPLASLLVGRLESEGIRAEMSGALSSAFRASAPGEVQILIHPKDAKRARKLLAEWDKSRK
jgi:hypothetical protein